MSRGQASDTRMKDAVSDPGDRAALARIARKLKGFNLPAPFIEVTDGRVRELSLVHCDPDAECLLPVRDLKALRSLVVTGGLKKLPDLSGLDSLSELFLERNCELSQLGESVTKLPKLAKMNLAQCGFKQFPTQACRIPNLWELTLYNNPLERLPDRLGTLGSLRRLNLMECKLGKLSPGLARLVNLTRLEIGSNRLESLPPYIGQLRSLKELSIHSNRLSTLPDELVGLPLVTLRIGGNRFTALPTCVIKLTRLKTLSLAHCRLKSLPDDFGKLGSLEEIDLRGNPISNWPAGAELPGLKELAMDCTVPGMPERLRALYDAYVAEQERYADEFYEHMYR